MNLLTCGSEKDGTSQMMKAMKLTFILMTAFLLQVSAHGVSQTVTFTGKDVSLKIVFAAIEKQTGYVFFYDASLLQESKPVTLNLKEVPLEDALKQAFIEQPLTWQLVNKTITIVKKDFVPGLPKDEEASIDIHGKVLNEKGEPVPSVTVTVKGTRNATATDANGEFVLTGVDANATLVFTSTNMETSEVKVKGKTDLAVNLKTKVSKLDEVQIIAYGTTTQRLGTGDVTTITTKEIGEQPINNPLLALEGRVPGMFITQNTGIAGGAVSVLIQGQNSIAFGTYPYYVIDGVPYASTLLPGAPVNPLGNDHGGNGAGSGSGNPLSFINPADIESISILKDADATAIYGSRAANGAVIITTKKGKSGKTKVDINAYSGWSEITRPLNLLNAPQYLQMRNEALANDGLTPSLANGDWDLLLWDTTQNTNWEKTLIGNTSKYNDIQASVSGGNSNTQILIGAGFHKETSVFPGKFADVKGSLHFNITNISNDQKFHVQLTGNYLIDNNKLPGTDPTSYAITLPPDAPPIYKLDGTLNWAPGPTGFTTWPYRGNPLAFLYNQYNSRTNNLFSNALVSYMVIPGLEVKSSFGYTNMQVDESNNFPGSASDPAQVSIYGNAARSAIYANNNIHSWIIEPQATYNKSFGKSVLNVLIGGTFNQITSNGQVLNGTGYNSDLELNNILAAANVSVASVINSVYKYEALFGRINYNWDDKYLLNLTIRRDGSSRFGPANQFHNFGAGGVAWIFSKENFIQNALPFLSFGKVRASYGTTGSDQIGDYQFMDLYSPPYGITAPYQGVTGNQLNNLYNPNLSWEETKKLEGGLELGFLNDDILLQATYYKNQTSNQLVGASLPYVAGFSSINENLPAIVQNDGWEFVLNTKNITSKNFTWNTSFNLTFARNILKSVSPSMNSFYLQLVGHPLNTVMLYHFLGVNDTTGVYQFASKEGPTSNPSPTDATVLKSLNPSYYGGLLNSFKYKGFQLDFLFQFVKQIGPNYLFGFYPGGAGYNQPSTVLKRWQKQGDITNIQRYNSDYSIYKPGNDARFSDGGYTDASYVRLKNLSISYQFPVGFMQKVHVQNLRVYVLGQNLLTISHYIGMDPENESTLSLPLLKVITMGIQVTL